jgi:DeoR/GlpR family transcriptional regulator of sugar metabolism
MEPLLPVYPAAFPVPVGPWTSTVKRSMITQSEEAVLLVGESKLGTRGQNAIARVTEVSTVLAAGAVRSSFESLRATGVTLRVVES